MKLGWADKLGAGCPATDCCRLLAAGAYRFANPANCYNWWDVGHWLRGPSNIVARRFEVP